MKQIVIGLGEVGTAIRNILECDGFDNQSGGAGESSYDVMHVCFPFDKDFLQEVQRYEDLFKPGLVIIHSTVPVGVSSLLAAVHSPIRGVHPDLEDGIRTFTKFFGGERAKEAAEIFEEKGIKTRCVGSARNTEAMKLWDTTQYGLNILLQKAIKAYCEKNALDFDVVYTDANDTYNDGYGKLGRWRFRKYVLEDFPGPIGGHCVQENWDLLEDPIAKISKQLHKDLTGS